MRQPRRANSSSLRGPGERHRFALSKRAPLRQMALENHGPVCPRARGPCVWVGWSQPFSRQQPSFLSICLLVQFWAAEPEGPASKLWPTDNEAGISASSELCGAGPTRLDLVLGSLSVA